MQVFKTTDFFGITEDEAMKMIDCCTVEEAKVLDYGEGHCFFETYDGAEKEVNSKECREYALKNGYEVMVFEFVSDNDNHCKYCMVFM